MVSFTGGIATGRALMAAAAGTVKKVALELGGKNPNIVFADADLEAAVDHALNAAFFHAGQVCSAGSRLLVQEEIHDAFVAAVAERAERIRLGSGLDADTESGPLISRRSATRSRRRSAARSPRGRTCWQAAGGPTTRASPAGGSCGPRSSGTATQACGPSARRSSVP
jgi:acyl-CoA reductase-like NAD-dependent aldehyde dehydrogenase